MSIAVININRLLDESKRGRALSQRLKTILDKWQAQIVDLETKIEKARQVLAKAPAGLPMESIFKMQRDLRAFEIELRHAQEMSHFELESHREQARATVLKELDQALSDLAKEKALSLVLTVPCREVAFATASIDLTDELMARYDKEAKG